MNRNNWFLYFIAIQISVVYAQKNAITVRPLPALIGQYGLQYERLLYKHWSIVLHGEYIYGPLLLNNQLENWIQNSMNIETIRYFGYEGYGAVPEIRYYFKDRRPVELEEIDPSTEDKLTGWFLGVYVPIRKFTMDFRITNPELHMYARQRDHGKYRFEGWMYGAGIEGGRHWVWGKFSLDVFLGIGYSTAFGAKEVPFTFDRNFNEPEASQNQYQKNKNLGILGVQLQYIPRMGISLGVAF